MKQLPPHLAKAPSAARSAEASPRTPQQELEYLAYVVSHDLQASVRHVSGFSQMLADEASKVNPDPARIQELSDTLNEVNSTLRGRLDAITRFSRIGRQVLAWRQLDWHELLNAAAYKFAAEIYGRQVDLTLKVEAASIPGDEKLMLDLLNILLENSLRFTREKDQPEILIEILPQGADQVMIRCVDNGIGFDQRRTSRMFKLFSVLHSVSEYPHVGLGTGLALARRIVQRLEGSILAQSQSQGASFAVLLPVLEEAPNSHVPADIRYPI